MNLVVQIELNGVFDSSQIIRNCSAEKYKALLLSSAGFSYAGIHWQIVDVDNGEIKARG